MLLSFFEFIRVDEHLRECVSVLPSDEKFVLTFILLGGTKES